MTLCIASDQGSGWQVIDQTLTKEGEVVSAKTVFLGLDEDDQLVWPEEYHTLLPR